MSEGGKTAVQAAQTFEQRAVPTRAKGPEAPTAPAPTQRTEPSEMQDDLERVRQLIMGGGDGARQPLRDAEVKRLRDALFGTKMEEYERRFSDLRRENDRLSNDLRQALAAVDELREGQRERAEGVEREVDRSIEELSRGLEQVRAQSPLLQQLLTQTRQLQTIAKSLAEQVSDLQAAQTREAQDLRALRSLIDQYRDQYDRGIETVKREKRQAEDELKAELRQMADKLDNQKVDRRSLAAVMLEIASRIETGDATTDILASFVEPVKD